jgi:acetyltransferase-like isoleucine patch superfamily enzyme
MNLSKIEPLFFRIPFGLFSRVRIYIYKCFGLEIGKNNRLEKGKIRRMSQVKIGDGNAFFLPGWCLYPADSHFEGKRIIIGNNNYFNRNVMIDACNYIEIGNNNMFGPDIYMTDSNHTYGLNIDIHKTPMQKGKIKIGNNCWIGAKSVILKDVELGDSCVVAAGAVVTKSFPAGSIIGGVPAKLIKTLM